MRLILAALTAFLVFAGLVLAAPPVEPAGSIDGVTTFGPVTTFLTSISGLDNPRLRVLCPGYQYAAAPDAYFVLPPGSCTADLYYFTKQNGKEWVGHGQQDDVVYLDSLEFRAGD